MQTGVKVTGVASGISGLYGKNSRPKLIVKATALDGSAQTYTSNAFGRVTALLFTNKTNTPIPIDIYINPLKPDDYYVNLHDIATPLASPVIAQQAPQQTTPATPDPNSQQ
mgnify:CR=1 FL=1